MKNKLFASVVAWMWSTMKRDLAPAVTILAACALGLAQTATDQPSRQTQEAPAAAPSTSACSFNFASGTGNTSLKFCVTANGNITQIETPVGQEFIQKGFVNEGYGVCNESPATAYWDYAADGESGNWSPAVVLSQTSTAVRIARNTIDGIWTLTQTISMDSRTPVVKVVMVLKNNTAAARKAYLVRYADIDAGSVPNNFDATANSAFGWVSTRGIKDGAGLTLTNVGNSPFGYVNGFAQNTFHGPNPCAFAFHTPFGPVIGQDGSVVLAYVETIGANQAKTATMLYRGM